LFFRFLSMRFSPRQFGWPLSRRAGSTPGFSALLLAALCVLLAAPNCPASAQSETRVAMLSRVIAASASSAQLSALEARQVKVLLAQLEKTETPLSVEELQRAISALDAAPAALLWAGSTPGLDAPPPLLHFPHTFAFPLFAHEAALLSGVRANSYLE
jgi:hypothetical protein